MAHKILLAAGGTGGHVIPSIAFGQWLQAHGETVVWLTGSRPLESEIFSAHKINPEKLSLEGSPLGVSGTRSLKRWKSLPYSFFEAKAIIKKENVDGCVLFGGYLSLPVLLAARMMRIPVLMHEQNTIAGKVTQFAAKIGIPVATAWAECRGIENTETYYAGMPLRPIKLIKKKDAQRILLGTLLKDDEKLIIILGGSLGSGGMKNLLQISQDMIKLSGYKILCMGIKNEDRPFPDALTHEACWDMGLVYSAADVVICRAGASTLAEIGALGVPAIVVPWMKSAGQHQLSNAVFFSRLTRAPVFLEGSSMKQFQNALADAANRYVGSENMSVGSENLYKILCDLLSR